MGADFKFDARPLLDLYRERKDVLCRKLGLSVGTSLVLKSPVGDPSLWKDKPPPGYVGGTFRRNWQHGMNIAPSGTIDEQDASGQKTIDEMGERINSAEVAGVHYFANNLPYGRALEYDGHSSQAPAGMVGITVVEFDQYVQEAVAAAKRKT